MHVHHFLQDENQLITIFDQIDTARMIILNEQVAVFDVQSDIGIIRGVSMVFFSTKCSHKVVSSLQWW